MIVVDVNILAYFFMAGDKTPAAQQLREAEDHWVAPDLWRHEFANILVCACLFSKLPLLEARRIWQDAEDLMRGNEYAVDLAGLLPVAVEGRATAYDAEYILLARSLGTTCVTEDGPLRKAFPADTVSMADFLGSEGSPQALHESRPAYRTRRRK